MKFLKFVLIATVLFSSCKLMKKDEQANEPKKSTMENRFTPVEWSHQTNIYEVNLRQYTKEGTFNAFALHLDELKEMGVETLWFMPITPIAQKNKKGSLGSYYACSDYTAINPEFGTLTDFKNLVAQAHAKGFKVIIDWVANHTGWDHVWTRTHPEYYLIDSATHDFKVASGMEDIIELNYQNPELRKAMKDAMKFWVTEADIDGFRCDLAFWVELDFWKEARKEIEQVKPLFWLGEFDELEKPEYGEAFDASYTWSWMHHTEDFYKKHESLDTLIKLLKRYDDLGDSTMRAWFTSNHDENSWNGTEYEKYGDMANMLAVFSATWNGIPLVYSGQELPNKKRLQFFEKDTIDWKQPYELYNFYRGLFNMKKTNPALRAGDPSVQTITLKTDKPESVLAYLRKKDNRYILTILNFSSKDIEVQINDEHIAGLKFRHHITDTQTGNKYQIKPWGYIVYEDTSGSH